MTVDTAPRPTRARPTVERLDVMLRVFELVTARNEPAEVLYEVYLAYAQELEAVRYDRLGTHLTESLEASAEQFRQAAYQRLSQFGQRVAVEWTARRNALAWWERITVPSTVPPDFVLVYIDAARARGRGIVNEAMRRAKCGPRFSPASPQKEHR